MQAVRPHAEYRIFGDDGVHAARRGQRQAAARKNFWRAILGSVARGNDDAPGLLRQLHSPANSRRPLSRNDPVGEISLGIDLQRAEHGAVEASAAHDAKRHAGIKAGRAAEQGDRLPGGIGERRIFLAFGRGLSHAQVPALLMNDASRTVGKKVGNKQRNTDAKVDHASISDLRRRPAGNTRGDRVGGFHLAGTTASTNTPGVTIWSGGIVEVGTISSNSATTRSAAMAIKGLKFRAACT